MKKFLFLVIPFSTVVNVKAQNVGIGTTSPSASSILDINSTTKGLLMPRMTSAQRTAILSPATGLLVFDTDTKTLWAYDAAAWKNLYTSGGGLVLPFSQTVNIASSALQVTNQGAGAAIDGISTAEFGTAMTAKTTGVGGWGLYAYSNRPGAASINAFADSGTVFHGENNYPLNNSTLMSLLNRGVAKTTTFQLSNSSSGSANVQIAGNNLGEQLLVFQTNAANTSPAVSIDNSGIGAGLYSISNGTGISGNSTSGRGIIGTSTSNIGVSGVSSTNYGVKGVTNTSTGFAGVYGQNTGTAGSGVIGVSDAINTQGVYGTSNNGIGVRAFSDNYRALQGISTSGTGVHASSASGTGVYATSTSGLALETVGNIKISGGNTNPSTGAVLTSDASGNAVWKNNKISFCATFAANTSVPHDVNTKVEFTNEDHDLQGNFINYAGTPTPNSSKFTAPVAGVYSFSAFVHFYMSSFTDNFIVGEINLVKNGVAIARYSGMVESTSVSSEIRLSIEMSTHLDVNDKVWIEVRQLNQAPGDSYGLLNSNVSGRFMGHLLYAD